MTQHHRATFDPKEMPDMPHMDTLHIQRNPHVPKPKMTPEREYILCEQAFGLRARGKTYRQMAALLGISVSAAYARAQTFMIAENEHHEHFPSDTRAECESLLRQTVGPVVADAQLGNLASFRALVSYSNTMLKWSKVPNPSRRKLCRRIERLKKYMDEQDPDLSPTRQKQAEMAEQMAKETGEQTGEHAENIGRTSGEQNQQPVAEQQVAAENTKSAPSSAKRPGSGGGSAGINVVLMMILLATVALACRAWAGYPSQRIVANQDQGSPTIQHHSASCHCFKAAREAQGLTKPSSSRLLSSAVQAGSKALKSHDFSYGIGSLLLTPSRFQPHTALLGGRMEAVTCLRQKLASFKQWHDEYGHAAHDLQATTSCLKPDSPGISDPKSVVASHGSSVSNRGYPTLALRSHPSMPKPNCMPPSLIKRIARELAQRSAFLAIAGLIWSATSDLLNAAEPREVAAVTPFPSDHAAKMREGLDLFRQQVRPVLLKSCVNCHGGKDTESEFDLTTREGLLKGGAEGKDKTVIAGDAKRSRLYKLITHVDEPKMPEEAAKLSDVEIGHIARWIDLGAPYDKPLLDKTAAVPWTKTVLPPEAKKFWSLEPLRETTPPTVKRKAWVRTPIDNFVLAKLEAKGIAPNEAASRRVLIRRASYDLLGLPPSPEEVETFVKDADPAAYEKLIDRLLESPHYGERWARHWLDVARFAESHGFEHDYDRKHAYHFRDFVIRALNDDMPYNQFLRWQLAGDELAPSDPLAMMATGFLGAGVFPTQITANEVERTRYDAMDDMASTTGSAMLGMSIGCARCHDHKFDPIPQADYYRILATFTTAVRSEIDLELPADLAPASPAVEIKAKKGKSTKTNKTKVMVVSEGLKPMRHHTQGADFFEQTYFLNRGDSNQKEGEAEQGFMQVLMRTPDREKHWQVPRPKEARTSLRRTALANWITDNKDGAGHLAARVIVNRLWQHHFGRGIVATPNDFGKQGDPPTHPELLDYLAARLIADGWRLKPLHKLMMTSAVYMQSSQADAARAAVDPENVLLWRRSAARLDGEAIRDSLLQVSGLLDGRMYGPGTLDENSTRRSIYFTVKRSQLTPMMQTFDAPEALVSQGARTTTTVAPQALLLMNAPLVRRAAESFAGKLANAGVPGASGAPPQTGGSHNLAEAVREGFQVVAGRTPTDSERDACLAFIESQQKSYQAAGQKDADKRALADFCQTLFALNEFVYVE